MGTAAGPTRTVRLPDARPVRARAVPGVAGLAVVPHRAARARRLRGRRGVAAAWWLGGRVRDAAGAGRRSRRRGRDDRVAYSHMAVTDVPLTAASRSRSRSWSRAGWSGRVSRPGSRRARSTRASSCSCRSSSPGGGSGGGSRSRSGSRRRVPRHEPVRARPPGAGLGRRSRVQRLARDGWLGFEHDPWALVSFSGRLWDGLGPALVIVASSGSWSRCAGARAPT